MKKLITGLLVTIIPFLAVAQENLDSLIKVADTHFLAEQYEAAHLIYAQLKPEFEKGSKSYNYVTDQMCSTFHYRKGKLRDAQQYEASNKYLKKFLRFMEDEKEYIRPLWMAEQKCVVLMDIIMNYFSLKQYDAAIPYKAQLYKMHRENKLPEHYKDFFFFDMFEWEGKTVAGYEHYEKLGAPTNSISFCKIIYEVNSRDENGRDKELLYQIQVLKLHKRDESQPDYILSKVFSKITDEMGGGMDEFTYDRVIDYAKLKKDVLEVLKGNYKKRMLSK